MLACAIVSVQSSLYGGLYPSLAYSTAAIHPGGPYLAQGPLYGHLPYPAAVSYAAPAYPAAISLSTGPYGPLPYGPGISLAAGPLGHGHGATYVAKTRGAVHTAPLVGHINSAAAVNLAPAPGTL